MSGLQRGHVQGLRGPEQQLPSVHALQLGHGAQVGLLQLLQLAVVLLVGEEDLAEVQAVCSALPQTVVITEVGARVLVLQLKRSKVTQKAHRGPLPNFGRNNSVTS